MSGTTQFDSIRQRSGTPAASKADTGTGGAINPELSIPLKMAHDEATRCIQCGFCLPACPTYKVFGEEKHSPRGRIQLVKSWAEGHTEADASLLAALDLCLDCRACEVACPIDVQYGVVLTGARDELADLADLAAGRSAGATAHDVAGTTPASVPLPRQNRWQRFALRSALRHVAAVPKRMRFSVRLTHRVLHSRFGRWLQGRLGSRSESWLGASMMFAAALPATQEQAAAPFASEIGAAPGVGSHGGGCTDAGPVKLTGRATLFLGCAQEGMFPETNRATASLLERAGFDLDIPLEQGCCGALHRHHGDKPFARTLAIRNLHTFGAFDKNRQDPIVMNAGGCMAWIKEAAELFEPGTAEHDAARRMAGRVKDISEVLHAIPSEHETGAATSDEDQTGAVTSEDAEDASTAKFSSGRVIYQPSCHLTNVCGVSAQPLALLQQITGGRAELPPDGGSCCGSAGIFNALHPEASKAILDPKMRGIADADPDVIVTSNPGCHLQMLAGVRAHGLEGKVRVLQLADFVAKHDTNRTRFDS